MDDFPVVSRELIEELEKRFPDRCPEPFASADEIRFMCGQVSVVRFLRERYKWQQERLAV